LGVLVMEESSSQQCSVQVSVVLPAYNEASTLEDTVAKIMEALEEFAESYEVIIAEDGSTDGTDKIAEALAGKYPCVKYMHGEKRLGRGAALKNAFEKSSGKVLVYMDVDLATDIRQLESLVRAVEEEEFDIAIGSRMLSESKVERTRTRQIASKSYSFLVRTMLGSKIKDYQCGFKAFRREPLMRLLGEVNSRHWFWDTEIIVRAFRKGYTIKEIPVKWKGGRETKVKLLKDSFSMGWQVIKLWWELRRQ
jgi:glycosyltransferase involved in cell wall biosynthesis